MNSKLTEEGAAAAAAADDDDDEADAVSTDAVRNTSSLRKNSVHGGNTTWNLDK